MVLLLASGVAKLIPRTPTAGGGGLLGLVGIAEISIALALLLKPSRRCATFIATVYVAGAAAFSLWDAVHHRRGCACFGDWIVIEPWIRLLVLGIVLFLLGAMAREPKCLPRDPANAS